ncbi:MAG: tRNA (adenosine(37)-N6)-dimethylallyltransferase MiaA [Chloroflexi bacterium]|nr:tRNA (adenosine(37)-N6)-dimethylallyltransferase MiaA [Chloroflexota bacterium]|tara:strand:- start:4236 stop:5150 length:915 start_codon:yes stop_codon:yes gene_type:complete
MINHKVISILGPTASGKSDLAIKIGQKFNFPIINCDSKLLYKGFDIGTAKPTNYDQNLVKHYMVDVLDLSDHSNLKWFLDESRKIISDLNKNNNIPILTGGTGQYLWGILEAWDPPKIKPNEELREKIYKEIEILGIDKVIQNYSAKYKLNSELDLENPIRLIRIIERLESGYKGDSKNKLENYQISSLIIGLKIEREESNRLIRERIKKMISIGWVEEVENLLKLGIDPNSPPMMSIGYREVVDYINGIVTRDEMENKIYISTRKLMRHQDNWFKKSDKRIKWINFENSFKEADIIISEWLKK